MSRVQLFETDGEKEIVEELSEVYSLIVTIDQLEKAYIRDCVDATAYTSACQRLLGQYATLLRNSQLERAFGDIDEFSRKYKVQCSNGITRIKVGVPATIEIAQAAPAENRTSTPITYSAPQQPVFNPQAVAEVTGNFITAMDGLKLNFRAKDQLHPLFSELVTSLNKVSTKDFEGRGKLIQWLIFLNKMKINDQLDDEQVRQCLFDLESAYKNFYSLLANPDL